MARTVWTGLSGQDNWERTARNGYPGQDQQDRTARTGLPGKDSQKRRQIARTGEPRQDCKERIARKDSQNWTTRTGRPWLTDKLGQYLDIDIRLQGFFASRQFVKKSPFLNLDCWRRFFKSIFLARYIKKKIRIRLILISIAVDWNNVSLLRSRWTVPFIKIWQKGLDCALQETHAGLNLNRIRSGTDNT
jgi:hypothetical protein